LGEANTVRPLISKELARNLYWSLVAILTFFNSTIVFYGFHEHHDGLMLSTIRLAKSSLLSGGEYPFNQYGSFWIAPYLGISLITPDSSLLASMRLITFILYCLTGVYTYKIAAKIFNARTAKISILIFLLAHPVGLEPIPWPSSVSLFLTVYLTWLIIAHASTSNLNHSVIFLIAAGAVCVMNVLTRVQIGFLSLVVVVSYLALTNLRNIVHFIYGVIGFSILYSLLLMKLGWFSDSLRDEFLFGWSVATNPLTDRTLPKTSLAFLALLLLLMLVYFLVRSRLIAPKIFIIFSAYFAVFALVLARILLEGFPTIVGKLWVAVLIFACLLSGLVLIKAVQKKNYEECLLVGLSFAAASQIYPLFDIMHAWWGLTPVVIILASQLDFMIARYELVWRLAPTLVVASLVFSAGHASGIASPSSEVDQKDLRFIRLDPSSSASYKEVTRFFVEYIPAGSSVLNLCQDARIFFRPNFVQSASRYFVYWPTMGMVEDIRNSLLKSKPEYVVWCSDPNSLEVDSIIKKFTSAPYLLQGEFQAGERTVTVYAAPSAR
jgi:hypothetical protein